MSGHDSTVEVGVATSPVLIPQHHLAVDVVSTGKNQLYSVKAWFTILWHNGAASIVRVICMGKVYSNSTSDVKFSTI